MTFKELELIFNRSIRFSFARKKFFLVTPILFVAGLLVIFCREMASGSSEWVVLSLSFLPIFLSAGLLIAMGVLLSRAYHNEVKGIYVSYKLILSQSWDLIIGISYLTFPLLIAYLVMWLAMGLFYLIREIPALGDFLSVVLVFAPFLILFGSIALSVFTVFLLFFCTPHIAFKSYDRFRLIEGLLVRFISSIFANVYLFILSLIPLGLSMVLLSATTTLTGYAFQTPIGSTAATFQQIFMLLPISMILTPGVIFFFNFALESYVFLEKKKQIS